MEITEKYYMVTGITDRHGDKKTEGFYESISGAYAFILPIEQFHGIVGYYSTRKDVNIDSISLYEMRYKFHTSPVVEISQNDSNYYIVKTKNSIYYLECLVTNTVQVEEFDRASMKNGEMYLELRVYQGPLSKNGFFMHNGELKSVTVVPHIGMFQDTYLTTDFADSLFDVRFMHEDENHLTIYHWSDGVHRIYFQNLSPVDYIIDWGKSILVIPPYQMVSIKFREDSDQKSEGLISPDIVSGKSLIHISRLNNELKKD